MMKLIQFKQALAREEFELYYQPYFVLDKKGIGIEALLRWNHPQFGLLAPASFLGVAEELGFMVEIEKWVLSKSIQDVLHIQQSGLDPLTLSVNISAQQFENPEFADKVFVMLKHFSFDPAQLILEVTERFQLKQENSRVLERLKQFGIGIAIDDFGSSYSSLQYLKDFPIDEVKIDRCFITDLESNYHSQKIVEMIIGLGHQLDLTVVAEGVETAQQLQILKELHCDKVQGFLFSEPVPLAKLQQKLSQWTSFDLAGLKNYKNLLLDLN